MSMYTRKLFPVTNQSTSGGCPYVCDSTCPYGCYPYVDLDYYIPPPSSPPPPPLLPPPQSSSKHLQNISPYIIISVALFASLFLLLSYYLIIVKNCSNWNRRRSTPQPEGSDEEFIDENRAPVIDHHIWYINTVGLQPSLINLIGEFKYKTGDGLVEGTDCSVCLSEFQDDESLRLLPKCNHAFHITCIDTWLRSHTNCPLCRAPIFSNTVNAPVVSIEPNFSTDSSPNEERQLETDGRRDGDGELNNNNEVRDSEIRENGTGVSGDQDDFLVIERSRSSKKEEDGEVQAMRRSVSVDSSIAASIGLDMVMLSRMSGGEKGCLEAGSNLKVISGNSSSSIEIMDSASMALSLHKEPVLMKKSFSYGGRSFFSRHHCSSSSVLPL